MDALLARSALYQDVAERLRQLIERGALRPGSWIDERALSHRFGISRTPLREALKVLHAEGLVRLTPRRGSFVAGELTANELDQLLPVIALLEARCASEAVARGTAHDLRRLEALHARVERHALAAAPARYHEAMVAFQRAVEEIAANPWLTRTLAELRRFLKLLPRGEQHARERVRLSLREHRRLMAALRRGDPGLVERALREHLVPKRTPAPASPGPSEPVVERASVSAKRRAARSTSPRRPRGSPGPRRAS